MGTEKLSNLNLSSTCLRLALYNLSRSALSNIQRTGWGEIVNVFGQNARDSGNSTWKKMCQGLLTTSTSSNVCLADVLVK